MDTSMSENLSSSQYINTTLSMRSNNSISEQYPNISICIIDNEVEWITNYNMSKVERKEILKLKEGVYHGYKTSKNNIFNIEIYKPIDVSIFINGKKEIQGEHSIIDELKEPILNDILYCVYNKINTLYYPSNYNKKYRLIISYDQQLINDKLIEDLRKYADLYKHRNQNIFQGLNNYINDRDNYVKKYKGQSMLLTRDGLQIIDKVKKLYKYPIGGVIIKIGHESDESTTEKMIKWNCAKNLQRSARLDKFNISIDVKVGKKDTYNTVHNMLVDTGSGRTTFTNKLKKELEEKNYRLNLEKTKVYGIGEEQIVDRGYIFVKFAGRERKMLVDFCDFKDPKLGGLIGRDILNTGKFDRDIGEYMSFTFHD